MVLIVEDDEDVADAEQSILADAGYQSVRASDGREALDRLRTMKAPCVVLLDLMMPGLNGWQFLECVGKDTNLASIPVVVTTAGGAPTPPGARDLIRKPYNLDVLLEAVSRYCPQRQAQA